MSSAQIPAKILRRNFRHAQRRRIRRRLKYVDEAVASLRAEVCSPQEAAHLLFGTRRAAKHAFKRVSRRQTMLSQAPRSPRRPARRRAPPTRVSRPPRDLSRLNRSSIFPPLLPSAINIGATRASEILGILKRDFRELPPHRLLDAFVTASGFSWEISADILFGFDLIASALRPHDIAAARHARTFWDLYQAGRARYRALVENEAIRELDGDWACFETSDFDILLPGIIIPTRLKRHDFLTNWVTSGSAFSLDVYSGETVQPLFRHPFPDEFNPLVFGTGRSHPRP
jgi:hypothetical protein